MEKIIWSGKLISKVIQPVKEEIDFRFLEDFTDIFKIDKEILEIEKEKSNLITLSKSPKTKVQIVKEIETALKNSIVVSESNLRRNIEALQTGSTEVFSSVLVTVDELKYLVANKDLLKQLYLLPSTNIEGVQEEVREKKIKDCNEKIEKLKSKKEKYFYRGERQWFSRMSRQVENWKMLATQCIFPVDMNGNWLDKNNGRDSSWLKIYYDLEFDKIPKHKLVKPLLINEIEYLGFPGFNFPGILKEEKNE